MNNKPKIRQTSFGEAFSSLCNKVERLGFDAVIYTYTRKHYTNLEIYSLFCNIQIDLRHLLATILSKTMAIVTL